MGQDTSKVMDEICQGQWSELCCLAQPEHAEYVKLIGSMVDAFSPNQVLAFHDAICCAKDCGLGADAKKDVPILVVPAAPMEAIGKKATK